MHLIARPLIVTALIACSLGVVQAQSLSRLPVLSPDADHQARPYSCKVSTTKIGAVTRDPQALTLIQSVVALLDPSGLSSISPSYEVKGTIAKISGQTAGSSSEQADTFDFSEEWTGTSHDFVRTLTSGGVVQVLSSKAESVVHTRNGSADTARGLPWIAPPRVFVSPLEILASEYKDPSFSITIQASTQQSGKTPALLHIKTVHLLSTATASKEVEDWYFDPVRLLPVKVTYRSAYSSPIDTCIDRTHSFGSYDLMAAVLVPSTSSIVTSDGTTHTYTITSIEVAK